MRDLVKQTVTVLIKPQLCQIKYYRVWLEYCFVSLENENVIYSANTGENCDIMLSESREN